MALKVEDIQFGSGTLYINGRNVGAVTDAVGRYEIEKEEHRSGQPSTIDKTVVSALSLTLSANLKEINPTNLRDALDLSDDDLISESGGTAQASDLVLISTKAWAKLSEERITSATVRIATRTTAAVSSTATAIPVENVTGFGTGDNITILGVTRAISSISGNVLNVASAFGVEIPPGTAVVNTSTQLESGTDYLLDPVEGRILALEDGALEGVTYAQVSYSYTRLSRVKVPIGVNPRNRVFFVEFVHKRDDGYMILQIPRGQVSGNLEFAFANEFHAIPISVTGLPVPGLGGIVGYVIFEYEV